MERGPEVGRGCRAPACGPHLPGVGRGCRAPACGPHAWALAPRTQRNRGLLATSRPQKRNAGGRWDGATAHPPAGPTSRAWDGATAHPPTGPTPRPPPQLRRGGEGEGAAEEAEKEAARAAFDAIPLMMEAELVRILAIDPVTGSGQDMVALGDELAVCLARHGLKTETTTSLTAGLSVGDELLNRLSDYGNDLLVMGCYGHSRLREMVFGGASRNILAHMTVPVLMSH